MLQLVAMVEYFCHPCLERAEELRLRLIGLKIEGWGQYTVFVVRIQVGVNASVGAGESYDEEPLPDLDSEAIDFRAASELFASKRKLKKTDLDTLRIVTKHQGRKVPTVGGGLLFGHERERRFPDAWIQAGRFDGLDKVRLIIPSAARRFAWRSSTTVWKSRIPACCLSV